ncbi:ATP-binding cassette domain-containing protein [Rickettsiales bacterium]|nr:ATP-binding cassette domain-containing protein [Rickettsiales bacterium]
MFFIAYLNFCTLSAVFTNVSNWKPISAFDFLKLNKNFSKNELDKVVSQVQIDGLIYRQLSSLSGGEVQKVLLANSLMGSPNLLILDEPDQNLDISGQLSFYKILNDVYLNQKISILMVSHDLHLVMSSTKKVICLFHHICCSGTPEDISKSTEFKAIFGQDMSRLVSVYNHYHSHEHG